MARTYVTANNRVVDIDALRLKNEDVRAVGNMGVNARGDKINNQNGSVESRNTRVSRQYNKQTNVSEQPVATSIAEAKRLAEERAKDAVEENNLQEVDDASVTTTPEPSVSDEKNEEPEGLAAAIARAREVKQEEIVPPRKAAQQKPGVKKI